MREREEACTVCPRDVISELEGQKSVVQGIEVTKVKQRKKQGSSEMQGLKVSFV